VGYFHCYFVGCVSTVSKDHNARAFISMREPTDLIGDFGLTFADVHSARYRFGLELIWSARID
jgi:hypothetical protein